MARPFRSFAVAAVVSLCSLAALALQARGAVIFDASGTSAAGNPVAFRATLAIVGDALTVELENRSPADTTAVADVLTSFYFEVGGGGGRPPLSLVGGSGFVWQVRSKASDVAYRYVPQTFTAIGGVVSDLVAIKSGDASWQFRTLDPAAAPGLGFGIGTAGNNLLSPNGFTPAVVGPPGTTMINFGIFRGGDIDPVGVLDQRYLVKNTATFTFSGALGFGEADIGRDVVFGLGTSPDSTISLPEPAAPLGGLVALATSVVAARRRSRRGPPSPDRYRGGRFRGTLGDSPGEFAELHPHPSAAVGQRVAEVVGGPQPAAGPGVVLPLEQHRAEPGRGRGVGGIAVQEPAEFGLHLLVVGPPTQQRAEVEDDVPGRFGLGHGVGRLGAVPDRRP